MKKQDLLTALEIVKPGLGSKEIVEQATSFAFVNGRVVTYNDEISISHPVEEGLGITGAVRASELYQLLTKIRQDDIELEVTENEIVLKAGRIKAGLTLETEIKLPLDDIADKGKWKPLPEGFVHALAFVQHSAGKDRTRPTLTCVHVNDGGWVEASDNFRITRYEIDGIPVKTFLIPAHSVSAVVALMPTKIAESKGWVHFKTDAGTTISCRLFAGDTFPETAAYFKDVEGFDVTLPRSTPEMLERAMVFSKRENSLVESVSLTMKENRLRIHSELETGGRYDEDVNMKFTDEPVTIEITPTLLKDILKETLTCTVCEDRLKFTGEGWVYVTALRAKVK